MQTLKIIFGIISIFLFQNNIWAQNLDSLTKVLETKMSNHKVFELQKEERIKNLVAQSNKTNDLRQQ
ncbi:hypothetical protein [Winogradskyella schleiferi]|uniref:hypothetical protein n=1 Tax=Winogradskyella schleiferi TaxID=2686078 RepID=UPI0015C189B4|nr:hypothetical protein [Winogradskyella schleiferi]